MELAAKMPQEASKSCFEEALEASWRRLGGALGGPRGSQEGNKSVLGGIFFMLKKYQYMKWSWNAFLFILGPPWRGKN